MPGTGLEMCDILKKQHDFVWMVQPMVTCKVLMTRYYIDKPQRIAVRYVPLIM